MPFRQWALMLAVPALAIGLWLVLPDSPVTVAILVIIVLVAVFAGVQRILKSRQLSEAPDRRPMTPPSVRPRG
jgi:membrane protein implicated in regulation of membrane protease activity